MSLQMPLMQKNTQEIINASVLIFLRYDNSSLAKPSLNSMSRYFCASLLTHSKPFRNKIAFCAQNNNLVRQNSTYEIFR